MIREYIDFLYFYFKSFFAYKCEDNQENCCGRK